MKRSNILQKDHEEMVLLCKRMKPEERLMAYFYHSQLISHIYQAGVAHRLGRVPPSNPPFPQEL